MLKSAKGGAHASVPAMCQQHRAIEERYVARFGRRIETGLESEGDVEGVFCFEDLIDFVVFDALEEEA
jgi:hypothetical protein